jgi:F-type H+-transporting ATPase subunit epsilon
VQDILAKGVPAETDAYLTMEAALRRSNLRLDAVKRYRRGTKSSQDKGEVR